jgi:hypothetical protein
MLTSIIASSAGLISKIKQYNNKIKQYKEETHLCKCKGGFLNIIFITI